MAPFKIPKVPKDKSKDHPLAKSPLKAKSKLQSLIVPMPVKKIKEEERIKRARSEMLARAPAEYCQQRREEAKKMEETRKEERNRILMRSKEAALKKFRAKHEAEKLNGKQKENEARARQREEEKMRRKKVAEEADERAKWREARKTCEKDIEQLDDTLQVDVEFSEVADLMASVDISPKQNEMEELLESVQRLSTTAVPDPTTPVPPNNLDVTLTGMQQQQPAVDSSQMPVQPTQHLTACNPPVLFHQVVLGTSQTMITEIPATEERTKKVRCFRCRGRNHLATDCKNAKWKDLRKIQKSTGVSLFKKTLSKSKIALLQMVPPLPEWEDLMTF